MEYYQHNEENLATLASEEEFEGKGKQIDYLSYLDYKKEFNETRTLTYSSSDLYRQRMKEKQQEEIETLLYAATTSIASYIAYKSIQTSETVKEFLEKAPLTRNARAKFTRQFMDNKALGIMKEAIDPTFNATPTLGHQLQSVLSSLEELSPAQIAKTLQLSSLSSLFVEEVQETGVTRHIKRESIETYQDLYFNMIKNESGIELQSHHIKNGFILEGGKLYEALPENYKSDKFKKGKVLLSKATIVHTGVVTNEDAISANRVLEKFANIHGVDFHRSQISKEPFVVVGAKSNETLMANWGRSYLRFSSEIGMKSLDNPAGFVRELVGDNPITRSGAFRFLEDKLNISLGSSGQYNISTRQMTSTMAKNLILKGGMAVIGLNLLDATLDTITPDSSVWSNGVVAGLADTTMKAHMKFARTWSDNFQNLKQAQEEAAPESTSLLTLMGVPLAGAMGGAQLGFFHRMYDSSKMGVDVASNKHSMHRVLEGKLGEALDKVNLNKATTTVGRYGKIGALAGSALMLPYIPGALVGKSSTELEEEYSGKKEVAVRKTRWWMMGGTAYEGEQIQYHRQNLLRVLAKDAETKTLYGDRETKRDLNPIFSPIKYLQNPYRFEEMHTKDMPMPVWGMDVSYGSYMGQIYKGTTGQVIKPTVVHPEVEKLSSDLNINLSTTSKRGLAKKLLEAAKEVDEQIEDENTERYSNQPTNYTNVEAIKNKIIANSYTASQKVDAFFNPRQGSKGVVEYSGLGTDDNEESEFRRVNLDRDAYSTPEQEKKDVKSMIYDGMMLRKNAPTVEPVSNAIAGTYNAGADFIGIKGFTGGLLLKGLGGEPDVQLRPELEISGTSTNFSRALDNLELGDAGGSGEFLRRLIPQSAASKRETVNPMRNQMAPEWLPQNETKYFKSFSRGSYYDKAKMGTITLPGSEGFRTLNPELASIDPNDLPLVYQYKILQNVARGSSEHIAIKKQLSTMIDDLSDKEKEVFWEAYRQDEERGVEKKFFEYADDKAKSKMGLVGTVQNAVWEAVAHKESPLEPLTPFRPMAKFVHQRTAVEDYVKTQILGPDTGIWTNPYSHFLKPSANRLRDLADLGQFKPKETQEKETVDEYFDKLSLVKASKNGDVYASQRNITALAYLGVKDAGDMNRFKNALGEGQSAYVEAFSKVKDEQKRKEILALVPRDVGRVYQSIWSNIDAFDQAQANGIDPEKFLQKKYLRDTKALQASTGIHLTREEKETINTIADSQEIEDKKAYKQMQEAKAIRFKAAKQEAEEYLENQTGIPDKHWIGWDPRLTTRDIKLKTLMVGRADIHKYGFWNKDVERIERLVALKDDDLIVNDLDSIIQETKANRRKEENLRAKLRSSGFEVSRVTSFSTKSSELKITNSKEYLEGYNEMF